MRFYPIIIQTKVTSCLDEARSHAKSLATRAWKKPLRLLREEVRQDEYLFVFVEVTVPKTPSTAPLDSGSCRVSV